MSTLDWVGKKAVANPLRHAPCRLTIAASMTALTPASDVIVVCRDVPARNAGTDAAAGVSPAMAGRRRSS